MGGWTLIAKLGTSEISATTMQFLYPFGWIPVALACLWVRKFRVERSPRGALYSISIGLLGGVGGPLDADDPDPGISQRSFELQGNLVTEPRTLLGLRLGRIEFDDADQLGSFHAPELEYVTIAGEYRFYKNWYDSGIFLGLGGYRLSGNERDFGGGSHEETAVGLTAGVTGEFEITQHFALLGEITGHYVDLDENNVFATAMGGFSIRF
jgi:hypothetical protein